MKLPNKTTLARNPKVNSALLEESLKLSIRLRKLGGPMKKGYNLRSPYDKRLVKVSAADLALAEP
jgi:hypothetical protein